MSQRTLLVTRTTDNLSIVHDFAVFPLHMSHVSLKQCIHNKNSHFYLPPSHHGGEIRSRNKLNQGKNNFLFSHSIFSNDKNTGSKSAICKRNMVKFISQLVLQKSKCRFVWSIQHVEKKSTPDLSGKLK